MHYEVMLQTSPIEHAATMSILKVDLATNETPLSKDDGSISLRTVLAPPRVDKRSPKAPIESPPNHEVYDPREDASPSVRRIRLPVLRLADMGAFECPVFDKVVTYGSENLKPQDCILGLIKCFEHAKTRAHLHCRLCQMPRQLQPSQVALGGRSDKRGTAGRSLNGAVHDEIPLRGGRPVSSTALPTD
nr:hypothetical protein Iba_chr12aCG5900 [Ipomoea batatas]